MRSTARIVAVLLLVLASAPACTIDRTQNRNLTVFAAASLTESFSRIGREFETREDVEVRLSFGPSDGLAIQIQEGAPVDVFASASAGWMDAVSEDPGVVGRTNFAQNVMALITPIDDPANISSLEDLAQPGTKLVLAAPGVPAGDYARQMLEGAGIAELAARNVVSNEDDVKGVVQKVSLGEADAGIVYRTDVTPALAGTVRVVAVPEALNVAATYPIAVLASSDNGDLARDFVSFVLGPGRAALQRAGFTV